MHEETVGSKVVKWLLIGISALFLIVMLLLPLITVISEALRSGWETYLKAVTDRQLQGHGRKSGFPESLSKQSGWTGK